ncbi:MAG: hypothetical protein ACEY3M_02745 [Wolbachia sp.]
MPFFLFGKFLKYLWLNDNRHPCKGQVSRYVLAGSIVEIPRMNRGMTVRGGMTVRDGMTIRFISCHPSA